MREYHKGITMSAPVIATTPVSSSSPRLFLAVVKLAIGGNVCHTSSAKVRKIQKIRNGFERKETCKMEV
jgi:hypothetical protein